MLALSVASARACLGARIAIFDDARHPSDARAVAALTPDVWTQTHWPRGGNLNGWPAADGIVESMLAAASATGAKIIAKIDCDTLVLADQWLDADAPFYGFSHGAGAWFFGACYAFRVDALARLAAHMALAPRHPRARVGEDACIGSHAIRMFGQDGALWPYSRKGLRFFCPASDHPGALDCQACTFQHRRRHSPRDLENMRASARHRGFVK